MKYHPARVTAGYVVARPDGSMVGSKVYPDVIAAELDAIAYERQDTAALTRWAPALDAEDWRRGFDQAAQHLLECRTPRWCPADVHGPRE